MDKFLNRMYDIFAFALPGMSILASVFFFWYNDQFLFQFLIEKYNFDTTWVALLTAFLGYIIGYLITPYTRRFLLIRFGIWLNKIFELEKIPNYQHFISMFVRTNLSEVFVRIREKTPRTSEYIEFWDMHTNFSSNMALAMIAGIVTILHKLIVVGCISKLTLILLAALLIAFVLFIRNALHYANWWVNDIDAALNYKAES